jgi:hypothetical protein
MYSSDITMAYAAEHRRELLCEAKRWRRSTRTRQAARANPKLAGRVHAAATRTGR